jgi:hypothetical protein
MLSHIVRYGCLAALIGLAGWASVSMPPEARAVSSDPTLRRYGFAPAGLSTGQTVRVTVVRPVMDAPSAAPAAQPAQKEAPELPDRVHMVLYDARGAIVAEGDGNLAPAGEVYTWQVAREEIAARGGTAGAIQVRAEVVLTPERGQAQLQAPAEWVALEVLDAATGRSTIRDTSPRVIE